MSSQPSNTESSDNNNNNISYKNMDNNGNLNIPIISRPETPSEQIKQVMLPITPETHESLQPDSRKKRGRPPSPYTSYPKFSRPSSPQPIEIPPADGTEKGDFVHALYVFMRDKGQPITKIPLLGYQELDLHRLYTIVIGRGGMDEVTKRQEWKTVYQELGIPTMSTSASYNTRTNYKKHLYLWELEHFSGNDRGRPEDKPPKYEIGQYVRIVASSRDDRIYYGRIVKCRWRNEQNMYYIHYNGWSNSHDEWMPEYVLSPLLEEESEYPEQLMNPNPTRSSKSNYIIDGPPTSGEATPVKREKRPRNVAVKGARSSPSRSSPAERSRSRDDGEYSDNGSHSHGNRGKVGRFRGGPTLGKIQDEMQKLVSEEIEEQLYLAGGGKTMSLFNMHSYNNPNIPIMVTKKMLEGVDARVPRLEDIIGSVFMEQEIQDRERMEKKENRGNRRNSLSKERSREQMIKELTLELAQIRKDYKLNAMLQDLYFGDSVSSNPSHNKTSPDVLGEQSVKISSPPLANTRSTRSTRSGNYK